MVIASASTGTRCVFPDVCKTPAAPAPLILVPYPPIAKTASAVQQKKTQGTGGSGAIGVPLMGGAGLTSVAGATAVAGVSSKFARETEAQQIRALLGQINAQLLATSTNDPNQWQALLEQYMVAAGALYVTLHCE